MSEARAGAIGLVRQTEMEFSRVAVIYARTDEVNGAQIGYTTADVSPRNINLSAGERVDRNRTAGADLTLRANHCCTLIDATKRLAKVGCIANKWNIELPLINVVDVVGRAQNL